MGLAISVGVLVDNSILVLENTYRYRDMGYDPAEASEKGAGEMAVAIIANVTTSLGVFIPVAFMGDGGEIKSIQDNFKRLLTAFVMAISVTFLLIAGLLESYLFAVIIILSVPIAIVMIGWMIGGGFLSLYLIPPVYNMVWTMKTFFNKRNSL